MIYVAPAWWLPNRFRIADSRTWARILGLFTVYMTDLIRSTHFKTISPHGHRGTKAICVLTDQ